LFCQKTIVSATTTSKFHFEAGLDLSHTVNEKKKFTIPLCACFTPLPKTKQSPDQSLESESPDLDTTAAIMGWWPNRKDL